MSDEGRSTTDLSLRVPDLAASRERVIRLCKADDVPTGDVIRVELSDRAVAVFNLADGYFVTDDACTHGPGLMSEGFIEDGVVECNFHGGQFDIRTGEVVAPPCMVALETYVVEVVDGWVEISLQ